MAYDGSIKIDTKVDTSGFSSGITKLKSIARTGCAAVAASLGAVTAGITAAATASVKVGSSFEAAMSKVSAISGATGEDLEALTDKAKEMGAKTKFSASESAEALQYMAMAGWDTKAMLDGIEGIMSLAAADGLDLATTSDIVTDAITAFGLEASDSAHFADVLAKASSSANTNVSMLGESFKYVAPLAGTMGYSVEDVSVALGLMANASVKGGMAGTSLRMALSNLASPTDQMAEVMDKYGISISDANENALPLIDVIKQLREKFGDLSETEQAAAASTLFGKEAMSGMLAIINASDSDFNKLVDNINNADGAAQSMSDTMQDNLSGQITILKSALEGLGIEIYESMQTPLKDAAVEAQNYVNRLTEAFTSGGLTGLVEEAGNIIGELAAKAAEAAPKMVNAAIKFLESFVKGISDNKDKIISAAQQIVKTLYDNLVKLLPTSVRKPVEECIKTLTKSFNDGGLKKAVNSVKTLLVNLGNQATRLAKNILPPLSKAVDFLADNFDILLPTVIALFAAFKGYAVISALTKTLEAHTVAVTAESLATAASTGTITLKQIAVGLLTGEITLATAAQYAWNAAMTANPIGLVIAAVAALAAGITALCLTQETEVSLSDRLAESEQQLADANTSLGDSYSTIGEKMSDFMSGIDNAGSILDDFDDSIILSNEKQQELADAMSDTQTEITTIASTATEERRRLTQTEIDRLDELFAKMQELTEQELAIEEAKQEVATTRSQALANTHEGTLAEYEEYAQKLAGTAEETRTNVIDKADSQYTEKLALYKQLLGTSDEYNQEWYDKQVKAAEEEYNLAIKNANKKAADTLDILQQGYLDRADALKQGTETLKGYEDKEELENNLHKEKMKKIDEDYNKDLKEINESNLGEIEKMNDAISLGCAKERQEKEENIRHNEKITKIRNGRQKTLDDENYQNQLVGFLNLMGLYETYSGKTNEKSQEIVSAFSEPLKNLPEDTQNTFEEAMQGAINGCQNKSFSLFDKAKELAGGFINTFTSLFQEHSPSKVFKRIFGYTLEGGEEGLEKEAPKLYKDAENIAENYTAKMQAGLNADGLITKMRSAVFAGTAKISTALTANIMHNVNVTNDDNNKKMNLKGDITTHFNINGREFAVATTPYISEELAWQG